MQPFCEEWLLKEGIDHGITFVKIVRWTKVVIKGGLAKVWPLVQKNNVEDKMNNYSKSLVRHLRRKENRTHNVAQYEIVFIMSRKGGRGRNGCLEQQKYKTRGEKAQSFGKNLWQQSKSWLI